MVLLSLALVPAALSLAVTARKSLSSLVKDCKFAVDNRSYDLCPLFNRESTSWTIEIDSKTPPTLSRHVYEFALDGPLMKNESLPDDEQCPGGTWVCLTSSNRVSANRSEPPRIIQLVPVAGDLRSDANSSTDASAVNITAHNTVENGRDILEVQLHGGRYVGQRQMARIHFLCDRKAQKASAPSFAWSCGGLHTFSWSSAYACSHSTTKDPKKNPDNGGGKSDPVNEEKPSTGVLSAKRPLTLFFMLTAYACGICDRVSHILAPTPTAAGSSSRENQAVTTTSRVAESLMVRWAEEDMGIEGEQDFMVNDRQDLDLDEQIPLKPSPGKLSSTSMNYGSAKN